MVYYFSCETLYTYERYMFYPGGAGESSMRKQIAAKAWKQETLTGSLPARSRLQRTPDSNHQPFARVEDDVAPRENARYDFHSRHIPLHSPQRAALYTKLQVSQPGDAYEQEADQVAEQVLHMAAPDVPGAIGRESGESGANAAPQSSTLPSFVHDALGAGEDLDAQTRERMEPRFGYDFRHIRLHTDERARASAQSVNALAYTVGRDIVLGRGQYMPGTREGQRVLAHELTHTIQQGATSPLNSPVQRMSLSSAGAGLLQRQADPSAPDAGAVTLEEQYIAALHSARQTGNWQDAAEKLNGFNREDILARLAQLTPDEVAYLHLGALDNPRVGSQSQVALMTVPGTPPASTNPPASTQALPTTDSQPAQATRPISEMTVTEKLVEAYNRADIGQAVREKVMSVLSPEALVIAILSFAAVFLASQFTPVGWAADLGLALTAVFVGGALLKALEHLINFAQARNATTPEQLDQAGSEFAQAVAEVEIDAIIVIITHGLGSGSQGGTPYEGPPPTGLVLATGRGGVILPVATDTISAEVAGQLGIQAAGGTFVLMSQGSGSGGGGSSNDQGSSPSSSDEPQSSAQDPINSASKREFFDLDEAATSALGEPATITAQYGPIGPVKSAGVRADLERLGYNPDEFRAVQYQATARSGRSLIITLFEADGGVYYGPHISSAND